MPPDRLVVPRKSAQSRRPKRIYILGLCPFSLAVIWLATTLATAGHVGLAIEYQNWGHLLVALAEVIVLTAISVRFAKAIRDAHRKSGRTLWQTAIDLLTRPVW